MILELGLDHIPAAELEAVRQHTDRYFQICDNNLMSGEGKVRWILIKGIWYLSLWLLVHS
jgi:hypothetical protein